ncbi:MAG: hypothetical protein QOJ97_2771 [Solirubrobacteraceae bacterium]|nr:hypothetical protein [Solirubrobacteraceae bacterium]
MRLAEDRWLAERLGRPAFTVHDVSDLESPLPPHLAPGFYQARVPAERVDVIRALQPAGFYVASAGITLARPPGGYDGASGVEVATADPARDAALLDVAESSFHASRFHLDPQIAPEVANRIKRDWVASYLGNTRGEELLAARADGAPVGFLAVIAGEAHGRPIRTIDLIAVSPRHRGSGAGAALVARFLADSVGRCDEVRVGTQGANPGATRFYERLGFTAVATAYDLHLHV